MKYSIILFCIFAHAIAFSQSITAKLIDGETKLPIPYANIKTGEYSGVISNDEGFFAVSYSEDSKTISISCMGYKSEDLSIEEIKALNFIIPLEQAINQLSEVYLSNSRPNVDSIIARVKTNLNKNYNYKLNAYSVFHRTSDRVNFKKLEFEIDKASHVKKKQLDGVNLSLTNLANQVKSSNMVQFADFKGQLYALNKDSIKVTIEKATELLDHKNDFSIEKYSAENSTNSFKVSRY